MKDSSQVPREDPKGRRAAGSAALLVVLIAILVQTGSALAVHVIRSVGVVEATWLRTAFAAVFLVLTQVVLRRGLPRLPPRGQRLTVVGLTLAVLAMNLAFYGAISRAPVGSSWRSSSWAPSASRWRA